MTRVRQNAGTIGAGNAPRNVRRDDRGRLLPGSVNNPRGTPENLTGPKKPSLSLTRILRDNLEKADCAQAKRIVTNLQAIALGQDRTAVEATKVILDRIDGALVREQKVETRVVLEGIELQDRLPPRDASFTITPTVEHQHSRPRKSRSLPIEALPGCEVVESPEGRLTVSSTAPSAPPPQPTLSPAQLRAQRNSNRKRARAKVRAQEAYKAGLPLDGRTLAGRYLKALRSGSEI